MPDFIELGTGIIGGKTLTAGMYKWINNQAKNIFWQVAGTSTLGTTSHFEGILFKTSITFQTGASINVRALAQTVVVLDTNVVGM